MWPKGVKKCFPNLLLKINLNHMISSESECNLPGWWDNQKMGFRCVSVHDESPRSLLSLSLSLSLPLPPPTLLLLCTTNTCLFVCL